MDQVSSTSLTVGPSVFERSSLVHDKFIASGVEGCEVSVRGGTSTGASIGRELCVTKRKIEITRLHQTERKTDPVCQGSLTTGSNICYDRLTVSSEYFDLAQTQASFDPDQLEEDVLSDQSSRAGQRLRDSFFCNGQTFGIFAKSYSFSGFLPMVPGNQAHNGFLWSSVLLLPTRISRSLSGWCPAITENTF